jgi:hypothetical protein
MHHEALPPSAAFKDLDISSRTQLRAEPGLQRGLHTMPFTELQTQIDTKNEYDKVIVETEAAYLKILESSQTLLTVLKRESVNIQKKRQAGS